MARIGKEAQARILQQIDVEHRKVAEVAAEHGCTPANVYALLGKLRKKAAHPAVPEAVAEPAALEPAVKPADLFAAAPVTPPPPAEAPTAKAPAAKAPAAKAPAPATASITVLPSRTLPKGLGAALAKPGFGLVMRTSEGEDSQNAVPLAGRLALRQSSRSCALQLAARIRCGSRSSRSTSRRWIVTRPDLRNPADPAALFSRGERTMPASHNLDRFVQAQDPVMAQVRRELSDGEKSSHWMWFVFPQIAGLGHSPTARPLRHRFPGRGEGVSNASCARPTAGGVHRTGHPGGGPGRRTRFSAPRTI